MPATKPQVKKTGPRSIKKAKHVKDPVLRRTKIAKKQHAASAAVGRSASYKRAGLWAIKKKNGGKFPVVKAPVKKDVKAPKLPGFYPTEDLPKPFARRNVAKPAKLRSSITPGTVLIVLSGRFRGKRVVFLKQLESGLLLVTGPYKINGVPIRRVNQAFVIATSTKVDISGVDLTKFTDKYFPRRTVAKQPKAAEGFVAVEPAKEPLSAERKADQKAVDSKLLAAISKTEYLKPYLGARFSLSKGEVPHNMVF